MAKFCGDCGATMNDHATFCTGCGNAFGPSSAAPNPRTPPPSYSPPHAPPPAPHIHYHPPAPAMQPGFDTSPMTTGQYLITFLILAIPLVGIIMTFVWAFGSGVNLNKKHFCRAILILWVLAIIIYGIIFLIVMLIGLIASSM